MRPSFLSEMDRFNQQGLCGALSGPSVNWDGWLLVWSRVELSVTKLHMDCFVINIYPGLFACARRVTFLLTVAGKIA